MAQFPAEYIPFDRRVKDLLKGIGIISAIAAVLNYAWFFYQEPKLIGTWTAVIIIGMVAVWFVFLWIWKQIDHISRRIMSPPTEEDTETLADPPLTGQKQAFPDTSDGVGGLLPFEKYQFAKKLIFGFMRFNVIQKNNPAHIRELSDRSNGLLKDYEINLALDQLIAEEELHLDGNRVKTGKAQIKVLDWTLIHNIFQAVKIEYWKLDKRHGDKRFDMAVSIVLEFFENVPAEKWYDVNRELLDVIEDYKAGKSVTPLSYDDVTGELEL